MERLLQDALRDEAEVVAEEEVLPYIDPVLRGGGKAYREFIADLDSRGLIVWRLGCRSRVGFFRRKEGWLLENRD